MLSSTLPSGTVLIPYLDYLPASATTCSAQVGIIQILFFDNGSYAVSHKGCHVVFGHNFTKFSEFFHYWKDDEISNKMYIKIFITSINVFLHYYIYHILLLYRI